MKNIVLILLGIILAVPAFSQDVEKKVKKKEKVVTVDVKKADDDKRQIKIVTKGESITQTFSYTY